MSESVQGRSRSAVVMETVTRRRRQAALLGLVGLLLLGGFALAVGEQSAQASHQVMVVKAIKNIDAGTVISADELAATGLGTNDTGVLSGLIPADQRGQLAGKTVAVSVPAGSLLPAGLALSAASSGNWDVPIPVKRMPPDLKVSDHVALLAGATDSSGNPTEFVAMQDVPVLSVASDSVSLWLPASSSAQIIWDADHGGIVVARMQPGAIQHQLPGGGPS